MQDVYIRKNNDGYYDIAFENGNIKGVDGLESAILVSLFTDARASSGDVRDPLMRRGWLGNILNEDNRQLGSTLWLADQARADQNTANFLKREVKNCLNWMLEDGIIKYMSIATEIISSYTIKISINLVNNSGASEQYKILFQRTEGF